MSQIKVELQAVYGTDRDIASAAWTSSLDYQKKKNRTDDDVRRVVDLLADSKHSVPFESVIFRWWIKLPIAIDRQFMTHRLQCLSGDNLLYFDLPSGQNNRRSRRIFKMSLEEFFEKWTNGIKSKTKCGKDVYKNHKKRLSSMRIRNLDETTGEIKNTKVVDIFEKGVQPVFEFEFSGGYKIKSTLNHKYLTDSGWKTIGEALNLSENLTETPAIFSDKNLFSVNGVLAYKDFNYMKDLRSRGLSVQEMADNLSVSYHTVRKWLKKLNLSFKPEETRFQKKHTPWNKNLTYKHNKPYNISQELRKKKSLLASGQNSNFWRGGITSKIAKERRECTEKLAKIVFKRDDYRCLCGSKEELNAHHIVPIYADKSLVKDINNLITLCGPCHRYIHKNNLEEEFAAQRNVFFKANKPKARDNPKLIRKFVSIQKVTFMGFEKTYDLEVEGPYHNFVCNGVVVHNSASGMSGRYRTMPSEFLSMSEDILNIYDKISPFETVVVKEKYENICVKANEFYEDECRAMKAAVKDGFITNDEYKRVREFLRGVLPQHNMTERVSVMNLRSLANFIKLRNKPDAQVEIRYIASEMLNIMKEQPQIKIAIEALERNNWII